MNRTGFVYVVEDMGRRGAFKVGRTWHLRQRVLTLAAKYRFRPQLVSYIVTNDPGRLERHLFKGWASYRIVGEWFRLPAGELARVSAVAVVNWKGRPPAVVPDPGFMDPRPHNPHRGRPRAWLVRVGEPMEREPERASGLGPRAPHLGCHLGRWSPE